MNLTKNISRKLYPVAMSPLITARLLPDFAACVDISAYRVAWLNCDGA